MAIEQVTAKITLKDEENKPLKNEEGVTQYQEDTVDFDFGDDLNAAVELCGEEVVFSQYVSAAKVALQGVIRGKINAGLSHDDIQEAVSSWKPGMVMARVQVDPLEAVLAAAATWSPEKRQEYIDKLLAGGAI